MSLQIILEEKLTKKRSRTRSKKPIRFNVSYNEKLTRYRILGYAIAYLSRYEEAVKACDDALSDKYHIIHFSAHGYLDYQTKRYEEAVKAYGKAIVILSACETGGLQADNIYNKNYYNMPVPNDLASLYEDLVNGTGESIISLFSDLRLDLKEKHYETKELIRKLDDIRLIFELLKRAYNEKTLNYEIYLEIEEQLYDLINKIKESNFEDANNIANELMEVFKILVDTNKMTHANLANVLIVEDTGQKLGDMRIFKTKRD